MQVVRRHDARGTTSLLPLLTSLANDQLSCRLEVWSTGAALIPVGGTGWQERLSSVMSSYAMSVGLGGRPWRMSSKRVLIASSSSGWVRM